MGSGQWKRAEAAILGAGLECKPMRGGGGAISVGCAVAGSYCAAAAKKAAVVAAAVAEAVAEAATEETEDGERGFRARTPPPFDKMAPRAHPPLVIPEAPHLPARPPQAPPRLSLCPITFNLGTLL